MYKESFLDIILHTFENLLVKSAQKRAFIWYICNQQTFRAQVFLFCIILDKN